MARCGRCGLWNQYPDDHTEKVYAGVCLWYQTRLPEHAVYESRRCSDFCERIPGVGAMEHFDYKVKRDNLGDAYRQATRAKRLAYLGVALSSLGLLLKFLT